MILQKTEQKQTTKCIECGTELTTFAAYIPGKGEACMSCYVKAAKEEEKDS